MAGSALSNFTSRVCPSQWPIFFQDKAVPILSHSNVVPWGIQAECKWFGSTPKMVYHSSSTLKCQRCMHSLQVKVTENSLGTGLTKFQSLIIQQLLCQWPARVLYLNLYRTVVSRLPFYFRDPFWIHKEIGLIKIILILLAMFFEEIIISSQV